MKPPFGQHEILPFHLATALVALLALVGVALWVGTHFLKRSASSFPVKLLLFLLRVAVGFLAILTVMEAVQRGLLFATNWPMWPLALTGAAAVEVVLALYELERRIVSRRVSFALAALRVSIALLVVVMLAQPVRSVEFGRTLQRYVAVLVDNSASMRVPDKQMTAAEKARLAEMLADDTPRRPYHFETIAQRLGEIREKLTAQIDWVGSLREASPEGRLAQLDGRRRDVQDALESTGKAVEEQAAAAAEPLGGTLRLGDTIRALISDIRDRLVADVRTPLGQAAGMLDKENLPSLARDCDGLLDTLRGASAALVKQEPRLVLAGDAVDEAFYNSLTPEDRVRVDAVDLRDRLAIARDVLVHRPARGLGGSSAEPSLLDRLEGEYGVRLYSFAGKPVEINLDEGLKEFAPSDGDPSSPGALDLQKTDLAAALEKVVTELPAERLAGIVLLTDGRHNAPSRVEGLARRMGLQQVPICSIVFGGGARPTTDAAIVSLDAPETVYTKDKLYLNAEVKLDGLAGKSVRVTLYDGKNPVDSDEIKVEADRFRTRVQLSDEPKESGLHAYRVRVEDVEGEVLATNNELPLSVSVSDEQTKLLVVGGRPRWEFRYLKNLFASRDRTVKLQYVLLHPDEIPGQKPRPVVHASAARAKEQAEATAPPENEAEWMKFDVIVLGDVEPSTIREEDQKAIRKFVEERGGTLIVVAGPRYMPHAYADSAMADMLPVTFEPVKEPDAYLVGPEKSFRIALTAEGRQNVITRLRVDPAENLDVWDSLPEIHWRHPSAVAKEGATVLAYALPPNPPAFLDAQRPGEVPREETILQRRQFERDHALISLHHMALGRVLFLSFDRSWRFRYRVGDTHHHRFWGQVLRWATADKLPAGTSLVKLGTERPRYAAHSSVRVRAKITRADFSPIVSDDVTASIYADDRLVLRKKMDFVPNSQGMYAADLGELPGGTYRYELDAPAARELLAAEGVDKVSSEFFVETAVPVEQVELAADRGLLERLATLTGGIVADPPRAADVLRALGPGTLVHHERRQWALWDSWPLLALIIALAGAEWLVRKRARLP